MTYKDKGSYESSPPCSVCVCVYIYMCVDMITQMIVPTSTKCTGTSHSVCVCVYIYICLDMITQMVGPTSTMITKMIVPTSTMITKMIVPTSTKYTGTIYGVCSGACVYIFVRG